MNKYLPKSTNNPQGFTLIELLITISIIAILAVIGIIVFGNVQRDARDARRREDIVAIAQALDVAKGNLETYPAMAAALFASGAVPADPTRVYCADWTGGTNTLDAAPAAWTGTTCPANYVTVAANAPAASTTAWRVCASLEAGTVFVEQINSKL